MKQTIAHKIYQDYRDDIISGRLQPGFMIGEKTVADRYDSSKMPVREALHQLCQEGYLISYPRRGYVVSNITEEDFNEVQQVRLPLEMLAVELVIKSASDSEIEGLYDILKGIEEEDDDSHTPHSGSRLHNINTRFHLELAKLSKNKRLYTALNHLIGEVSRAGYRFYSPASLKERHYHEELINAISERNVEKAKKILCDDLAFQY